MPARRRSSFLVAGVVAASLTVGLIATRGAEIPVLSRPVTLTGVGFTSSHAIEIGSGLTLLALRTSGQSFSDVMIKNASGAVLAWELLLPSGARRGTSLDELRAGRYQLVVNAKGRWTLTIAQPRPTSGTRFPHTFTGSGTDVVGPIQLPGAVNVTVSATVHFATGALYVGDAVSFTVAGLSKAAGVNCAEGYQSLSTQAGPNYIAVATVDPGVSWSVSLTSVQPQPGQLQLIPVAIC